MSSLESAPLKKGEVLSSEQVTSGMVVFVPHMARTARVVEVQDKEFIARGVAPHFSGTIEVPVSIPRDPSVTYIFDGYRSIPFQTSYRG
jgi:hypothetical protein